MFIQYLSSHSLVLFIIAVITLFLLVGFVARSLHLNAQLRNKESSYDEISNELTSLRQHFAVVSAKSERVEQLEITNQSLVQSLHEERIALARVKAQNEAQQGRIDALHENHEEKLANMAASEQRLQTQFENLANRIFEEKQQRYTTQTKQTPRTHAKNCTQHKLSKRT